VPSSAPERVWAIGIDLGTTNSCVAVVDQGTPRVIPIGGYLTTPSVIAFAASGRRLVGHPAKRQAITNPQNTIIAMKRLIGRKWEGLKADPATAHQANIIEGPNGDVRIELRDKTYSLPELSAMLLQELRTAAEEQLHGKVTKAVITVPAYFNDNQRQATRDAGAIAGLEVIAIINEPTAAALTYGSAYRGTRTLVVYDLGGGTFDVSVVNTTADGGFEVLSTGGDTSLGGEDFDARIIAWLIDAAKKEYGVDLSGDNMALQRLKFASETAKVALASAEQTEISLPFIHTRQNGDGVHLTKVLTRAEFEVLTADLVARTVEVCSDVLKSSGKKKSEIDDVLLVGGSSRMPHVQSAVTKLFGKVASQRVNPDEAVAIGAALHADSLMASPAKLHLIDVTPQTLGILTEGAKPYPVIARNTQVPTKQTMTFSTRPGQKNVDFVVMQGDAKKAKDNELLGKFRMSGFGAKAVEIDVTFAIDTDGIVQVTAHEKSTGQEQTIRVTASSGLSDDELDQMTAASNQYLVEKKKDLERMGAVQEVHKAIAVLEKIKKDGLEKGGGKRTNSSAGMKKVTAAIDTMRSKIETADVGTLKAMAGEVTKLAKALKG
jgi:molecular chaperone DnaK